jgi:hypothetical protein
MDHSFPPQISCTGSFVTSGQQCGSQRPQSIVDVAAAFAMFQESGELATTKEQDQQEIDVVKAANPGVPLYGVLVDGRLYVFRPIREEEYERGGFGDVKVMKEILTACMLLPSQQEFESDLGHHCALRHVFMQSLLRIAGNDPRFNLVRL